MELAFRPARAWGAESEGKAAFRGRRGRMMGRFLDKGPLGGLWARNGAVFPSGNVIMGEKVAKFAFHYILADF